MAAAAAAYNASGWATSGGVASYINGCYRAGSFPYTYTATKSYIEETSATADPHPTLSCDAFILCPGGISWSLFLYRYHSPDYQFRDIDAYQESTDSRITNFYAGGPSWTPSINKPDLGAFNIDITGVHPSSNTGWESKHAPAVSRSFGDRIKDFSRDGGFVYRAP